MRARKEQTECGGKARRSGDVHATNHSHICSTTSKHSADTPFLPSRRYHETLRDALIHLSDKSCGHLEQLVFAQFTKDPFWDTGSLLSGVSEMPFSGDETINKEGDTKIETAGMARLIIHHVLRA